jgi:predicted permease
MTRLRSARLASRIYRALVRVTAPEVRGAYASDMRTTFDVMADAAAAKGVFAVAALLARESFDLIRSRRMQAASTPSSPEPRRAGAFFRDLYHASRLSNSIRALSRRPGFSATAMIALAAGTAATTAVFSLVDTVVIKALPYPDPDRVVAVMEASPAARERISLMAPVRIEDWQRMSRTFAAMSGAYSEANTDTSQADPERLDGRRVAPRYFEVFGARPVLGRTFADDEERFGGPGAAVISDGFWARRFQRSDRALGRTLTIGGRAYPIVGVMPAGFAATSIDVWLPAQVSPELLGLRDARFLSGVGRLKAGVTVDQARADLDRVQRELGAMYPKTDAGWSAEVWDLKSYRIGDQARSLWLVFGAVGLLWLIAMTNVAGLVLVETRRRARELAIRLAIGASRGHVVGVVVHEVLVLAAIGSAFGVLGAAWLVSIARSSLATLPRISELTLDARAATFAVATGALAAVLCGLVPAVVATRRRQTSLAGSGARIAGGSHRWQRGLVAAQVALSLLLSASAVLLLRSYYNLTHADPGFSSDHVLTFHVAARWDEDRNRVGHMQEAIFAEAMRMPGVEAVGLVNFLPASNATLRYQVKIPGIAGPDGTGNLQAGSRTVSAGYLRALKVPLLAGDWCPALKTDFNGPQFAMVNRQFAERFAPGMSLVGHQMMGVDVYGGSYTITGVIGDIDEDGPQSPAVPYVYNCASGGTWPDPNYVVRTADPAVFAANLNALIRRVDPTRAVFAVRPLEDTLGDAVEAPRLNASLVGAFASGAMLLAAVGLYGLFTLIVSESRREIGVRLALGARPVQVVRLVFADAGRLMVMGLAAGLVLSVAANRAIRGLLFEVGPLDPGTFVTAVVILVVVASAAIAIPALRASRVAPTEALVAD